MITDKRKTLGVFINKTDLNFQIAVQQTVQQRARELGYDVFFFYTVGYRNSLNSYDVQEKGMFEFTPIEQLDGALITPDAYDMPGFRESLFDMLDKRAKCPIVCVRDGRSHYDSYFTDEKISIQPLLDHLLDDHGYRRVCFLAGYAGHPDSQKRQTCYMQAMSKRGIPLPRNAVFHGTMWTDHAEDAYNYFFSDPSNPPEAIVCANDYMALALVEVMQQHGVRVPEDVAVTGFDNIDESTHAWPSMTTVEQDYKAMIDKAMERLHSRILAREKGLEQLPAEHVGVPGSLVLRESCGCTNQDAQRQLRAELSGLTRQLRRIHEREVSQTYFSIELNNVTRYEDIHNTIFRKLEDVPNLRDFYLCMFEDENGFASRITPRAQLISAIRDRQDIGMPFTSFDRQMLLPSIAERGDEPQCFYVHLLHQRDEIYGYTVMQLDQGNTPSMFYMHWNIIISIALRNLADQAKLLRLYEERRVSSITDVLTGIYNRRGFNEKLEERWLDMCRQGRTVCFVSLDLDNLKPINDTYGHLSGDEALRTIARAVKEASPAGAVFARVGGDEFLAFLPDCDEQGAAAFRTRLDALLEDYNRTGSFNVGASVGAKVITLSEGLTVGQCVHLSDEIMYQEKNRRHAELKQHARSLR